MRVPSSTPAGILTDRLRRLSARPSPSQLAQGSAITSPLPRQVGQPRSTTKKPCWARTLPAPPQVEQVCARLCPLAPAAVARVAPRQRLDGDVGFGAGERFLERQLEVVAQVGAAGGVLAAARAGP